MKILFVVQNYYPSVGGTQLLFQQVAEKLVADHGDEVEVFTTNSFYPPEKPYFKKIDKESELINGVKVQRFRFVRWHLFYSRMINRVARIFNSQKTIVPEKYILGPISRSLMKAIDESDADVIIAGTSPYVYMQYPLYRFQRPNPKPFVFQGAVHFDGRATEKVIRSINLESIKKSDHYLANTHYEECRLLELGVEKEKIEVTGCGVDIEAFEKGDRRTYREKFNLKETDVLVGYIGRIEPTKGIEVLLDAFQKIDPAGNIYLVIAGFPNDAYLERLKAAYFENDNAFASKIHLLGALNEQERSDLFHALDIFVLPSASESFGIVFLEAWACRKPVIGAGIGAVKSLISEGRDGLLFEPGNADDLREKILILDKDSSMRNRFGWEGYKKVLDNYTWSIVARKYRETCLNACRKFKGQRSQPDERKLPVL